MSSYQYIIITGNPCDGFEFTGPFADTESAIRYAESNIDGEWWTGTLEAAP